MVEEWGEMKYLTKIWSREIFAREILMEKYHSYFVQAHPKEVDRLLPM